MGDIGSSIENLGKELEDQEKGDTFNPEEYGMVEGACPKVEAKSIDWTKLANKPFHAYVMHAEMA
jgi:hypothetical protein